jgi:glycine/D-amino acid oxidase-like deaminating enzyme
MRRTQPGEDTKKMSKENHTVIIGGGIIGLSIAYYLSLSSPQERITIIDSSSKLLESASGFAGGFLARDWFDPRIAAFGDFSFNEHRRLAEAHGGRRRWGYAGAHVYSLNLDDAPKGVRGEDWLLAGTSRAGAVGRGAEGHVSAPGENVNEDGTPSWICPQEKASWATIAGAEDCAQVEPRRLCEFLLEECEKRGVKIYLSTKATQIVPNTDGKTSKLKLESTAGSTESQVVECSNIVLAAGCWTPRVFATLFPQSRISIEIDSLAGHSLLYRTSRYAKPFVNIAEGDGSKIHGKDKYISYSIYCPPTKHWSFSAEAYARLNQNFEPEIWIGGLNHDSKELPLPELATDSKKLIRRHEVANLRAAAVKLTGVKGSSPEQPTQDDLDVAWEGLCFRPVSKSGVPIIGKVGPRDLGRGFAEGGANVWVAGGHGPWGIVMGLGTGIVMADMLSGKNPNVDISAMKVESGAPLSKL